MLCERVDGWTHRREQLQYRAQAHAAGSVRSAGARAHVAGSGRAGARAEGLGHEFLPLRAMGIQYIAGMIPRHINTVIDHSTGDLQMDIVNAL